MGKDMKTWIPVSKQVPKVVKHYVDDDEGWESDTSERVLAFSQKGFIFITDYTSYDDGGESWSYDGTDIPYRYIGEVTHWMPLPEPPK